MPSSRSIRGLALLLSLVGLVSACSGGSSSDPPDGLSAEALVGWELIQNKGCVACHGTDGGGGTGPSWIGVAGTTRPLADGTDVVADRAYLTRAVADPQAEQVRGYTILMPQVPLTEAEVASIVALLEEL